MAHVASRVRRPERDSLEVERGLRHAGSRDRGIPLLRDLHLEPGRVRDLVGDLAEPAFDQLPKVVSDGRVAALDLDLHTRRLRSGVASFVFMVRVSQDRVNEVPTCGLCGDNAGFAPRSPLTPPPCRLRAARASTRVERGAGGVDVVDQQHAMGSAPRADGDAPLSQALRARRAQLTQRRPRASQRPRERRAGPPGPARPPAARPGRSRACARAPGGQGPARSSLRSAGRAACPPRGAPP